MSVHFFHGDKGGVGKSLAAIAFADWLVSVRGLTPLVVDGDVRNADVERVLRDHVPTKAIDLRHHDGWIDLLSVLDETDESDVVISLPAGIGELVAQEIPALGADLEELGLSLILFWLLNRAPDSIALLRPAMDAFAPHARAMVVVRNLFFGDPTRFERWAESQTRRDFEAAGGLTIDLPELHDRLVDLTMTATPPLPFSLAKELRLGEQAELRRWLARTKANFDKIADRLVLDG